MTTGKEKRKEMSKKDNGRSAQKARTSLDLNANVTASSLNMNASVSERVQVPDVYKNGRKLLASETLRVSNESVLLPR
jgi:hypothetical protein